MAAVENSLQAALSDCRRRVQDLFRDARGRARGPFLRLLDALDRVLLMIDSLHGVVVAGTEPRLGPQVNLSELLEDATQELRDAARLPEIRRDASLCADIDALESRLLAMVARAGNAHRGGSRSGSAQTAPRDPGADIVREDPLLDGPSGEDPVSFTAAAPAQACAGDEFVARFAAYLPADEEHVRAVLAKAEGDSRLSVIPHLGTLVRGTEIEIVLEASGLHVDGAEGRGTRRFTWDGKPQFVEFEIAVAADAQPRRLVLRFLVRVAGIVLQRVPMQLEIGTVAAARAPHAATERRLPSNAFASYSSKDRLRVQDRVAAIRIALGIDVFLDCMDLNPSEAWERRLRQEIDQRELFILFWSSAAAASPWVDWEWHHAYTTKGVEAMQIQPLENGVKAPRELSAVHFADPYMDLRQAELARREACASEAAPKGRP